MAYYSTAESLCRTKGAKDSAQGKMAKPSPPWVPCTPHTLRQGRALNGRGRSCATRKATTHGTSPFATSPALLQSATLGAAGRCHPNPGLARSSQRPGLTPAALWPAKRPCTALEMRRPHHAKFAPASAIPPISAPPPAPASVSIRAHPWSKKRHPGRHNQGSVLKIHPTTGGTVGAWS